jgi:thiosulfate reductase cytochrome b subunit
LHLGKLLNEELAPDEETVHSWDDLQKVCSHRIVHFDTCWVFIHLSVLFLELGGVE